MPHVIDFDGLEKNIFMLQHICYGSRQFCEVIGLNRFEDDGGDYGWWKYSGLLKSIVSNTVIEAAIKVRMLQDYVKSDEHKVDLNSLDADARKNIDVGRFVHGDETLSLRESCNKIVHATEARLQWDSVAADESSEYWNGLYHLWGTNRGVQWRVELKVEGWCIAMIRFNDAIQNSIDWSRVYKYDE